MKDLTREDVERVVEILKKKSGTRWSKPTRDVVDMVMEELERTPWDQGLKDWLEEAEDCDELKDEVEPLFRLLYRSYDALTETGVRDTVLILDLLKTLKVKS